MADLIERYKITANLPSVMMNYCNRFNSKQIELITEMIYELEKSIESADVQPVKRGRWIEDHDLIRCSVCGFEVKDKYCEKRDMTSTETSYDFCPKCSADMRGEDNG